MAKASTWAAVRDSSIWLFQVQLFRCWVRWTNEWMLLVCLALMSLDFRSYHKSYGKTLTTKTHWTHMLPISFTQIRKKCINFCRVPCTLRFQSNERDSEIKEQQRDDDGEQRTKPPPYPNIIWLLEMVNISSQQYNSSQRNVANRIERYFITHIPYIVHPANWSWNERRKKWKREEKKTTQLILFVLCETCIAQRSKQEEIEKVEDNIQKHVTKTVRRNAPPTDNMYFVSLWNHAIYI